MSLPRSLLLALVVAALQIGFLAWMIQGRASVIRNGQEVLLRVKPIDPRDLLRGDYVRLGYDAAEIPAKIVQGLTTDRMPQYGSAILVRLAKQADGYWMPVSAIIGDSNPVAAGEGEVDVKATVMRTVPMPEVEGDATGQQIVVDYGIERYYVPEGDGRAIETDLRERPFGILAAVDKTGAIQIKALMDGDKKLYVEPLY